MTNQFKIEIILLCSEKKAQGCMSGRGAWKQCKDQSWPASIRSNVDVSVTQREFTLIIQSFIVYSEPHKHLFLVPKVKSFDFREYDASSVAILQTMMEREKY